MNKTGSIISYLSELYGKQNREPIVKKIPSITHLPTWVGQLVRIIQVELDDLTVYLLEPKRTIAVDQAVNLYKITSTYYSEPVLIIADLINSNAQASLVRMQIPHVTSKPRIFAPNLGVSYRKILKERVYAFRPKLSQLSVKLCSYFLTDTNADFEKWTLKHWYEAVHGKLDEENDSNSLAAFSRAFQELAQHDIVEKTTIGVEKIIEFNHREVVWKKLISLTPILIKEIVKVEMTKSDADFFHLSGDSALSKMSELSPPNTKIYAIGDLAYKVWKIYKKKNKSVGAQETIDLQIWNLPTLIFPKNPNDEKLINPILLALSFREDTDPRIQLCVQEMLDAYKLNANALWRNEE